MEILVYFVCIAVASFAVLVQPVVAQGANTPSPLTYPRRPTLPRNNKRERERGRERVVHDHPEKPLAVLYDLQ